MNNVLHEVKRDVISRATADGFLHLPNFFCREELTELWEDIDRLADAFADGLKLPRTDCEADERDRRLVRLVNARPDIQSALYDRLQTMPSLLALPSHPKVLGLARAVLGTERVGVWPRVQLRFDRQTDEKNLIGWHHDYLYNQGTEHSYTFWIPLVSITPAMGMLLFAEGSHRRAAEVQFNKVENGRRFDYDLDKATLSTFNIVSHDAYNAGDLVLFHSKFIHSGQLNADAERARLTALFRMQDLTTLEVF